MNLSAYLRAVGQNWVTLIICSLIGTAIVAAYVLAQPTLYAATASSYVSPASTSDVGAGSDGQEFAKSAAANLAMIAETPYVLDPVRSAIGTSRSAAALADMLSTDVASGTSIIRITATTDDPQLSSALANGVAAELSRAAQRLNPNVGNASSIAQTTTVAPATTPTSSIGPAIFLNLAIGLMAGLALGVLVTLVRLVLDQRIRSTEQLVQLTGAPVFSSISASHSDTPTFWERRELKSSGCRVVAAEVFSSLPDGGVLLVAPVESDAGLATLASGVSVALARLGVSTVIVDTVGVAAGAPGLSEVLSGQARFDEALVLHENSRVALLPVGKQDATREDLVASVQMRELIRQLSGRYAVVLVICDEAGTSAAVRSLSNMADAAILTCLRDSATFASVRAAGEALERGGTRLLGTALVEETAGRAAASTSRQSHSIVVEA